MPGTGRDIFFTDYRFLFFSFNCVLDRYEDFWVGRVEMSRPTADTVSQTEWAELGEQLAITRHNIRIVDGPASSADTGASASQRSLLT